MNEFKKERENIKTRNHNQQKPSQNPQKPVRHPIFQIMQSVASDRKIREPNGTRAGWEASEETKKNTG